jgi:F-type H+-transporting ATPase subunit b
MSQIISSLGFDGRIFVAEIVLYLVLLKVLDILFWKPYLAHLEGRDKGVADAYRAVEDTRHEMERLRAEYQQRINQIEADARARIQSSIKAAEAERERILATTRAESEAMLRQGTADLLKEKTDAMVSLRGQVVDLAISAVDKALGTDFDRAAVRMSVEQRLAQAAQG